MEIEELKSAWKDACDLEYNNSQKCWEINVEKTKDRFEKDTYYDKKGVLRWNSNDSVPPDHCLSKFAHAEMIDWEYAWICSKIGEQEKIAFLTQMNNDLPEEWDANPEVLMEARMNVDEGVNEVYTPLYKMNLKTGKCYKL